MTRKSVVRLKEADIQRQILDYLVRRGVFAWRNHTQGVRIGRAMIKNPAKGAPDILGVLPGGRFLGIEVKRPGEKQSQEQVDFADGITLTGGVCIVATSVEELVPLLDALLL